MFFFFFFKHGLPRISFQKKKEIFPHPIAFDEFIVMALEDPSNAKLRNLRFAWVFALCKSQQISLMI